MIIILLFNYMCGCYYFIIILSVLDSSKDLFIKIISKCVCLFVCCAVVLIGLVVIR